MNKKPIKPALLCPFHDEKTPSFITYTDGSYHCFGCGEEGELQDEIFSNTIVNGILEQAKQRIIEIVNIAGDEITIHSFIANSAINLLLNAIDGIRAESGRECAEDEIKYALVKINKKADEYPNLRQETIQQGQEEILNGK